MYKTIDAPLTAHVEINTSCNQRCCHCYNFWRGDKPGLDMRLSEVLATRTADQLSAHKVFHVILTGGEPLINRRVLNFFMSELSKRNITFSLNSNLALLTEKSADELHATGLRTILTSLLSYDAATHDYLSNAKGSFHRVVHGINIARAAGLRISVNMVVMKPNLLHIRRTGELAHELGAFGFSATRVLPPRSTDYQLPLELLMTADDVRIVVEQLLSLRESGLQLDSLIPYPTCFFDNEESWLLLSGRTCSAGKTSIAVASDGSVRACPHHEVVYSSLLAEDLRPIWLRMSQWRDGTFLPQTCRSCTFVSMCGGGCRVASPNGNICGEDAIMMMPMQQERGFLKRRRSTSVVDGNTKLRVRDSCRFRQDKALGIINTGGIKNTFVTHETLALFEDLHAKKLTFTPELLCTVHGIVMEKARYLWFLGELVDRSVLVKV